MKIKLQKIYSILDSCIDFFPFIISNILIDNGLEIINRLLASTKGNKCMKPFKLKLVVRKMKLITD